MPEPSHAERRARARDVLKAMTGEDPAAVADRWEAELGTLGSYAIDFSIGDIWSRPGMSPRDRCFVVICMLATIPEPTLLREYVGYGLNLGLTEEDIQEAFVQIAGYAGFARAIAAQRAADEVFAQRRGVEALPARQPAAVLTDEQRRDNVIDVLGQMNKHRKPGEGGVGQRRQGPDPLGTYSRIAARYNWGEVWARGGITSRERSLAVVASLIVQSKIDEANIHCNGLLNRGGRLEDIEEIMVTATAVVGFPTGIEGFRLFRRVEAERGSAAEGSAVGGTAAGL